MYIYKFKVCFCKKVFEMKQQSFDDWRGSRLFLVKLRPSVLRAGHGAGRDGGGEDTAEPGSDRAE